MKTIIATMLALAGGYTAPTATAQTVTADPERVAAILRAEGYRAQVVTEKDAAPLIRSAGSGVNYTVFFANCDDRFRNCTTVQFYLGFDFEDRPDASVINDWNRTKRFGRAYIDDTGDPVIEMDVNLDHGGVPEANFVDQLSVWNALIGEFQTHVGWRK